MTDDDHQPAIPGIAQPDTVRVRMDVHPVTIAMTSPLWYWWAQIAIRQERRTWAIRRKGLAAYANDDLDHLRAKLLNDETLEAIQAVAAARHSIHNLYRTWANALGLPIDPDQPRRTREHKVTLAHITSAAHTSNDAGSKKQRWRPRTGMKTSAAPSLSMATRS